MYYVDAQKYHPYALNVANIYTRSSITLPVPKLPLITEILDAPTSSLPATSLPKILDPTNVTHSSQSQTAFEPSFPKNLIQSKLAQIEQYSFDKID